MFCSIYLGQNQNGLKDEKGTEKIFHSRPLFPWRGAEQLQRKGSWQDVISSCLLHKHSQSCASVNVVQKMEA